jgi:hypothetical protein
VVVSHRPEGLTGVEGIMNLAADTPTAAGQ